MFLINVKERKCEIVMPDPRIKELLSLAQKIISEQKKYEAPSGEEDEISVLGQALGQIEQVVQNQVSEMSVIGSVTKKINEGLTLDDLLKYIYESFSVLIPYDRIGLAFLEEDGQMLVSVWSKANYEELHLKKGYKAKLQGSSLEKIIETNKPRIINDLEKYFEEKPESASTKMIRREGIFSSLTCPLIVSKKPMGFIFFSSKEKETYKDMHSRIFEQIAAEISLTIEKSRLYQKMMELSDTKSKFLAMAAHDLRNPLGVIKGNLDLIEQGMLGDVNNEQKESLTTIKTSAERMLNLINTFLDVSAIEEGKFAIKKEKVELEPFFQQCLKINDIYAKAKTMTLQLDIANDIKEAFFDSERISEVITNLVSNAIKYSEQNTKITIGSYKKDNDLVVYVSDEGQGIPEDEISKLFGYFSTTSIKSTAGEKSIGIGLSIAKKIVDAHGGKIWAENNKDKGARFVFSIPLEEPKEEDPKEEENK
jgi:signal transduction histidine kinase